MDYLGYGLAIRSGLAIPGALSLAEDARAPDITIAEGPARLDDPERTLGPYRLAGDRLLFEIPGVARYLCSRDGTLMIERAAGTADHTIAGYLVATALPAMLWLRGETVLHAAAVLIPGAARAIAIAGPSGSGKSSLVEQMVGAGARVVADDTLCIRMTPAGPEGSGLPGGYFLGAPPRRFHPLPDGLAAAPLAGLAILDLPRGESIQLRRLSGVAALEALLANRHRPRIPKLLGLEPGQLAFMARLAAALPVHRWRRREGSPALTAEELALLSGA